MVMDFAPGTPLLGGLSGPAALVRLPAMARDLPDRIARHMAALHKIPCDPSMDLADDSATLTQELGAHAAEIGRNDLASTADWLLDHKPDHARSVICHGDLHPFNILTDPSGDTVLDWSATRVTDPAYDVAFTRLLLSHPPLSAPRPLTPLIAAAGGALGKRFTGSYDAAAPVPIDNAQLEWFTNLHALRIATEVATWESQDELDNHDDHPFVMLAGRLTNRLADSTGILRQAR